jgi:FHA domain-containing protein/double zinc ribbon protein
MSLVCQDCKHENSSTATDCESCGAKLLDIFVSDATQGIPSDILDEMFGDDAFHEEATIDCPICERPNPQSSKTCMYCNAALTNDMTTKPLLNLLDEEGLLVGGNVRFSGNLVLREIDTDTTFVVSEAQLSHATIGRVNRITDKRPTVDLSQFDAIEMGVSRYHATINKRDDHLVVLDHSSLNGTYINGQRLVPEKPRVLRDNDRLRIGRLLLMVTFEATVSAS